MQAGEILLNGRLHQTRKTPLWTKVQYTDLPDRRIKANHPFHENWCK